mmetsp:Transcript_16661/g.22898  ORF Transcript_16661/g.22898 Transcript_16661/m.22898 type:complete len:466 (-) Transcript_16661:174-1571(-)
MDLPSAAFQPAVGAFPTTTPLCRRPVSLLLTRFLQAASYCPTGGSWASISPPPPPLGSLLPLLQALEQEDLVQALLHVRVRRAGPAGDAQSHGALGQEVLLHLNRAVHRAVLDGAVRPDAVRAVHVVGPLARVDGDLQQVRRVAGVPAAHHQDEVQGLVREQLLDGVLPLLGGVADRVELDVGLPDLLRPVGAHHRLLQQLADGAGLLLVHGGLVSQAHLAQVLVGIEPLGHGVLELGHEFLLVPPVDHVVADVLGLLDILHNQVSLGKRGSGNSLLMCPLAMDDCGEARLHLLVHHVPHLCYPGAGRIYNLHAFFVQGLHLLEGSTERRKDNNVIGLNRIKIFRPFNLRHDVYIHLLQLLIHLRVMDKLISHVDFAILKFGRSLKRHGNCSFNSPAQAVLLRKSDGDKPVCVLLCCWLCKFFYEIRGKFLNHPIRYIGSFILEAHSIEFFGRHDSLALGLLVNS